MVVCDWGQEGSQELTKDSEQGTADQVPIHVLPSVIIISGHTRVWDPTRGLYYK